MGRTFKSTLFRLRKARSTSEPFIVTDDLLAAECLGRNVGADDVNAIQGRFPFNVVRLRSKRKPSSLMNSLKCLPIL